MRQVHPWCAVIRDISFRLVEVPSYSYRTDPFIQELGVQGHRSLEDHQASVIGTVVSLIIANVNRGDVSIVEEY